MHLITFDIDGTLVDSQDCDSNLYIESIREVLKVNIDSDWSKYPHVTDSGILDYIIEENNLHHTFENIHGEVRRCFVKKTRDYISYRSGVLPEIPGAKKLIEALHSKPDAILAIATGGWKETAKMKLWAIGINPDELTLATASDSSNRIEIMKIAEGRALNGGFVSKKTYFGDGEWDKSASEQLNYQFLAVGNNVEHNINLPDFRDLSGILTKLAIQHHFGLVPDRTVRAIPH